MSIKDKQIFEFESLFEKYPANLIMNKMNINSIGYNRLLAASLIRRREYKDVSTPFYRTNFPYSKNEDDYGIQNDRRKIITKEGLFEFLNSPLIPRWSYFSVIANRYKLMLKEINYEQRNV